MKPDTRTVTQLFERDVRYVVPLYQRPYVWNEEDQWDPLGDDVVPCWTPGDGTASTTRTSSARSSSTRITQAPGKIPVYTVIDGQQRLTTLQILLAAASNVAAELGAGPTLGFVRDLVDEQPRRGLRHRAFQGLADERESGRVSRRCMADGGPQLTAERTIRDNRIDEALRLLSLSGQGVGVSSTRMTSDSKRLESLRITLCELLKIVSITLEADDNAQVIFETLNARGTPLARARSRQERGFPRGTRQDISRRTRSTKRSGGRSVS